MKEHFLIGAKVVKATPLYDDLDGPENLVSITVEKDGKQWVLCAEQFYNSAWIRAFDKKES